MLLRPVRLQRIGLRSVRLRDMIGNHDVGGRDVGAENEALIGARERAQCAAAQPFIIDGKHDGDSCVAHAYRSIDVHAVGPSPRVTATLISRPEREMSRLALRSIAESERTEPVALPSNARTMSPCCRAACAAGPWGSRLMIMSPVFFAP